MLLYSCKLFETKDTTPPLVNLTIEGGNEISREVTLYLDIEDDSRIDEVSVVIGDSTYSTLSSNFDTIQFIVNTFEEFQADSIDSTALLKNNSIQSSLIGEQVLYVTVTDKEGNIGESEKLDVVITEFPGWRKYFKSDYGYGPYAFLVDDNNRIWIGYWDGCKVYDPQSNNVRELTFPDTVFKSVVDFALIEGSRVWIATDNHISEYHHDLDKWLQVAVPPPDTTYFGPDAIPTPVPQLIWTIALDNNYDLYVGTNSNYLFRYNGADFNKFRLTGSDVFSLEVHPDGTVYYFNEWGQQSYIKNDIVYPFENFPYEGGMKMSMIIDSNDNLWIEPFYRDFGCYIYDGNNWTNLRSSNPAESVYPLLCTNTGLVYTENIEYDNIHGIATYDGETWTYFSDLDSPFNTNEIPSVRSFKPIINEAPNGDIWMVAGGQLMRYRPSLGGYP